MNSEMIYENNKVMIVDENGKYLNEIEYYDNLRKVLLLENKLEKLNVMLNSDKGIYKEYSEIKDKNILKDIAIIHSLIIIGIPAALYCLSGFDGNIMNKILEIQIITQVGSINTLDLVYIITEGIIGLPTTIKVVLKDYNKNQEKNIIMKTLGPKIEKTTQEIIDINKEIKELESNKEIKNNKYNDFDIINIETNELVINKTLIK